MDPVIAPSVQLMNVNAHLVRQAVEGLSREEVLRRPGAGSNPFLWVLGHLVVTRVGALEMLGGGRVDAPWGAAFRRGATPPADDACPDVGEIMATFAEVSTRLQSRLDALGEAELQAPSPRAFPVPDKTMRGAIAFLSFHETYHVGQLAYLRRWLGRPGLVD